VISYLGSQFFRLRVLWQDFEIDRGDIVRALAKVDLKITDAEIKRVKEEAVSTKLNLGAS